MEVLDDHYWKRLLGHTVLYDDLAQLVCLCCMCCDPASERPPSVDYVVLAGGPMGLDKEATYLSVLEAEWKPAKGKQTSCQ